ncbi:MAG TPA: hypothetical protein VMH90_05100, partial [Thermoplasmata archaeon]|nr:hypothetical protein [Thermoplasmata archaeon]
LNTSSQVTGLGLAAQEVVTSAVSIEGYSVAFAPAVPLTPSAPHLGAGWTGTSAILAATGGWSRTVTTSYSGLPTPDSRVTARQNLTAGGSLSVTGSVQAPFPLTSGESVLPVSLSTGTGTFRLLDGIALDVLGGSLFAASASPSTGILETPAGLDYDGAVGSHLGIVAASLEFQPLVAAPVGSSPAPAGASVAGFEPPSWTVQAAPEPVSAALAFFSQHGLTPAQVAVSPGTPARSIEAIPLAWVVAGAAVIGCVVALGLRWRATPDDDLSRVGPLEPPVERSASPMPSVASPSGALPSSEPRARDPFDDLL